MFPTVSLEGDEVRRWVRVARGFESDSSGDAAASLGDYLSPYGYAACDVAYMPWLGAAVLSSADALAEYVEETGGDLGEELAAAREDALDAMNGLPPTALSRRHDLSNWDFRDNLPA